MEWGGLMTIGGNGTTIHHNCTNGNSYHYGLNTGPSTSSSTPTSGTVVLMSGIRVGPGSGSKLLPLQLLADYVTGHVGSPNEQ